MNTLVFLSTTLDRKCKSDCVADTVVQVWWIARLNPDILFFSLPLQYSQKEDKYEEEIKVLTDKLKEVRFL